MGGVANKEVETTPSKDRVALWGSIVTILLSVSGFLFTWEKEIAARRVTAEAEARSVKKRYYDLQFDLYSQICKLSADLAYDNVDASWKLKHHQFKKLKDGQLFLVMDDDVQLHLVRFESALDTRQNLSEQLVKHPDAADEIAVELQDAHRACLDALNNLNLSCSRSLRKGWDVGGTLSPLANPSSASVP